MEARGLYDLGVLSLEFKSLWLPGLQLWMFSMAVQVRTSCMDSKRYTGFRGLGFTGFVGFRF